MEIVSRIEFVRIRNGENTSKILSLQADDRDIAQATKETCNAVVGLELGDQDASSSIWTSLVSASHFSIPVPDPLPETLIDGNDFGRDNAR